MLKTAYLAACVVLFAASFSFVRCQQTLFIDDGVNFGQKPVLQLNTKYSEQLSSLAISDKVISVKTRLLAKYESDGSIDAGFNVSEKCINATENILLGVLGGEMWAMKMVDADGKIPSGLMDGNVVWIGAFDECLAIHPVNVTPAFNTRYCTTQFGIPKVKKVPYVIIATCLPDVCSAVDASGLVNTALAELGVIIEKSYCNLNEPLSTGAIAAFVVSGFLALLVFMGTSYDIITYRLNPKPERLDAIFAEDLSANENTGLLSGTLKAQPVYSVQMKNSEKTMLSRILMSFSFLANGEKLLNTKTGSGALTSANGMRVISMIWVMQGHTYLFILQYLDNPVTALEVQKRFGFQAISNATYSVDSFFFLSGMLVCYLGMKSIRLLDGSTWRKRTYYYVMYYFHRFWRLTPAYAYVMLLFATLMGIMTSGPFTPMLLEMSAVVSCSKYWWTNLLYISNLYPDVGDNQCMAWSWYLSNDMQFYWGTPIIIYFLYRYYKVGLGILLGEILICTASIATIYSYFGLKFGTGMTKHQNTYYAQHEMVYTKPYARIAPYAVGMMLGYLLHRTNCRIKLHKSFVLLGWCVAIAINLAVLYGLYGIQNGDKRSIGVSVLYESVSRCTWSLGLAWVIFACVNGYGGPVDTILSWKFWAPLGRLTYCVYLVHPIVMYTFYLRYHVQIHFTDVTMVNFFVSNVVLSYGSAFIVSMLIEAPMMGLEKIFFKRN